MVSSTRAGSAMTALSVISSLIRAASTPLLAIVSSSICGKRGSSRLRIETLMASGTVIETFSQARLCISASSMR